MKKILMLLVLLVLPVSSVNAEVKNVKISEGKTLYSGSQYNLVWNGEPEPGVTEFSVWLVGGNLSNSESKFLGTADADENEFTFTLPRDVQPGKKFSIQLSGKGASGNEASNLTIKKAKKDTLGKKRVMLQNPNGFVLYEGEKNIISWKGGKDDVKIGVKNSNGDTIGWIKLDGKPNSKLTWDTKKVCDLALTTCWDTKGLLGEYPRFKLIAVSADTFGNYSASNEGNYDESDEYMAISAQSNVPSSDVGTKNSVRYTIDEILRFIEIKYKKGSTEYENIKSLFIN